MKEIKNSKKERALLITVLIRPAQREELYSVEEQNRELEDLVRSSKCEVVESIIVKRNEIDSGYYIGKGKIEEITDKCEQLDIDVVVFGVNLTAAQQMKLEDIIGRKTIDWTQLILDIFSQHAKSNEGKVQVELAQLEYMLPRLRGKGIMLSRLGGGIGTRGPGEQKLEVDRRHIEDRVVLLKKKLKDIQERRALARFRRIEDFTALVSLVGYTNAGKSTLLNSLTDSQQRAKNELFSTLDPLTRTFYLPSRRKILLSDTVGFLNHLPKRLLESFRATLEELEFANLLLHIVDISDHNWRKKFKAVEQILKDLNLLDKPQVVVFNKIDLVEKEEFNGIDIDIPFVKISARNGYGFDDLFNAIETEIMKLEGCFIVKIPINRVDLLNLFYRKANVMDVEYASEDITIQVVINKELMDNILGKNKDVKIAS